MEFKSPVRTCLFLPSQAEEAARFYVDLIADSAIDLIHRPDPDGPALVVEFTLGGGALHDVERQSRAGPELHDFDLRPHRRPGRDRPALERAY